MCYAWGRAKAEHIRSLIDSSNNQAIYAAVHVEELYEALRLGLLSFTDDLETDSLRHSLVLAKANKFFSQWDVESVEELIEAIDNSEATQDVIGPERG